ncbi:MAG TPA: SDR family NAD(P)-dependent oxidoreductase, partial [Candidatus Binatia bacterium]|nr:SDR family NAD(P)-dependent oxidoreductase [Candidatus Binatia bacterium]
MKSLQDKIVVVTGASRGVGLQLARTFALEGSRVAMAARDQRTLADAAEKIADSGGHTLPFACDV